VAVPLAGHQRHIDDGGQQDQQYGDGEPVLSRGDGLKASRVLDRRREDEYPDPP
jgi:hypothetical protein